LHLTVLKRRFGGLISYQNSGKGCTIIADKVGKSRSGYATARIDIHRDQILISA